LTLKLEAFILVPKCTNAESLVTTCPMLFKNCVNNFWDARTDAQTDSRTAQIHNASGHYTGRGIIRQQSLKFSKGTMQSGIF